MGACTPDAEKEPVGDNAVGREAAGESIKEDVSGRPLGEGGAPPALKLLACWKVPCGDVRDVKEEQEPPIVPSRLRGSGRTSSKNGCLSSWRDSGLKSGSCVIHSSVGQAGRCSSGRHA